MGRGPASGPGWAILRHALRGERVRLGVIAAIWVLYAVANVVGYRDTYGTAAERARFATAFKDNIALRLFYGVPRDLASVGGYAEFRVAGILSIVAAAWGLFAAVRALRGEEDSGCYELMLAGAIGRGRALAAAFAALGLECLALLGVLWVTLLATAVAPGDMTAGQTLLLSAGIAAPAAVFVAVGALTSQLAPTARGAQAMAGALVAFALLVRIAADVTHGHGWLRWLGPLGWTEEVHPVTGARPGVLLLFLAAIGLAGGGAVAIAARRDIGNGLFRRHDARPSRFVLLGSPSQAAARAELVPLAVWVVGVGVFAVVLGAFAQSIADEARRSGLRSFGLPLTTARGYLSVVFSFFAFVTAMFAVTHVGGLRDEEGSGRLETLLALPVGRRGWLAGRLALAGATTAVLALAAGVLVWLGSLLTGGGVGLVGLLAAGVNCLPVSWLFLGLGVLAFAALPRSSPGVMLTLVSVVYLWQLVGALVSAPSWLLAASPFHFVSAVPERAFDLVGAGAMVAVGVAAGLAALAVFERRDLRTG